MEIITPVGRIVGGHPMVMNDVKDPRTGEIKMSADGVTPRKELYFGLAIPKNGETHWNQTSWGATIATTAATDWPNGEHGAATFAWKITDGDSAVPNKVGKKPCDKEGYPGHWVINLSTALPVKCYHVGNYDPMAQIQDKNEIKPGDYGRAAINVKGNAPSQSPGVYLNPTLFELTRAGELIVLDSGTSAAEAFGGNTPAAPTPASAPVPPHTAILTPPPVPPVAPPAQHMFNVGGNQYTGSQLLEAGWTQEQIDALGQ